MERKGKVRTEALKKMHKDAKVNSFRKMQRATKGKTKTFLSFLHIVKSALLLQFTSQ